MPNLGGIFHMRGYCQAMNRPMPARATLYYLKKHRVEAHSITLLN